MENIQKIEFFIGEYAYLSNFYMIDVVYDCIIWPSTEHIYQAYKSNDINFRKYVLSKSTPSLAKQAGNMKTYNGKQVLRNDWDSIKVSIMEKIVFAKFNQNFGIRSLLEKTNDSILIEGNTWHDNFWGNCICPKCKNIIGKNILGKILMKFRNELRKNNENF